MKDGNDLSQLRKGNHMVTAWTSLPGKSMKRARTFLPSFLEPLSERFDTLSLFYLRNISAFDNMETSCPQKMLIPSEDPTWTGITNLQFLYIEKDLHYITHSGSRN